MSKTIQIRDVPDQVHERLVARAASEGRTLSEMLRSEVGRLTRKPNRAEVLKRIRERDPIHLPESSAELVRRIREEG